VLGKDVRVVLSELLELFMLEFERAVIGIWRAVCTFDLCVLELQGKRASEGLFICALDAFFVSAQVDWARLGVYRRSDNCLCRTSLALARAFTRFPHNIAVVFGSRGGNRFSYWGHLLVTCSPSPLCCTVILPFLLRL